MLVFFFQKRKISCFNVPVKPWSMLNRETKNLNWLPNRLSPNDRISWLIIYFSFVSLPSVTDSMMGRFAQCRDVLRDFAVDSTFHGFPHIVISPLSWLRVMWVIIIVAAMCIGLMQITWLFSYYLTKPIEVETKVQNTSRQQRKFQLFRSYQISWNKFHITN